MKIRNHSNYPIWRYKSNGMEYISIQRYGSTALISNVEVEKNKGSKEHKFNIVNAKGQTSSFTIMTEEIGLWGKISNEIFVFVSLKEMGYELLPLHHY